VGADGDRAQTAVTRVELIALVESVRALPYGRPSDRTVDGMWHERRGTCSTKHAWLLLELRARFATSQPELVHRVYRVDRDSARALFGEAAARVVPDEGLVDVHRYLTLVVDGTRLIVDVTFPGAAPWDGATSMALACGEGDDFIAGENFDDDKRRLEAAHCDPRVREPFIAALTSAQR
jgi:hypothetical protein